jgi:poly(hydroxyalkanoate) granule-associated protein
MAVKKAKKSAKSKASKATKASKAQKARKKTTKAKEEKWTWADVLRTPILASVGAFSMAEEGIENFVKDIVERGEASEKDGKKIVSDFRKRTARNRKDFEKKIDDRIEKALKAFRLPTNKDVNTLLKKVARLEKRVDALTRKKK